MIRLCRPLTPALAFLVLAVPSQADTAEGRFVVKGAGRASCSDYIAAREQNGGDYRLFAGWLDGYITGVNRYEDNLYDLTPWQTTELLLALLAQGCATDTSLQFGVAVNKLLSDFSGNRLVEEGELLELTNGDTRMFMHSEIFSRVAETLRNEGFDPGEVSDSLTPGMIDALKSYQASKGIAQTGIPDQNTLLRLFVRTSSSQ